MVERFINRTRHLVIPYIAVMVTLGAIGFGVEVQGELSRSEQQRHDLREAQVDACERGNVNRRILRGILRDQIEQSKAVDPSFFPNIPPEVLEDLLREQTEGRLARIKELTIIPCEHVFPE